MDKKFEAKIMGALRKLTKQWPPIIEVRKKTKIGPELHQCPLCNQIIYTGKRSLEAIKLKYPDAIAGRMDVDHIVPVIAIEDSGKSKDWNKVVDRLFCGASNIQSICSNCHLDKTKKERERRVITRRKNK